MAAPRPNEPIPRDVPSLARTLTRTTAALYASIDAWLASGRDAPPRPVALEALYQQRIYRLLASEPQLARATIRRLPPRLAAHARDSIAARRALAPLATPRPLAAFRVGPPLSARVLLRHYAQAERRFGVAWHVLAAVHFVESAFGKVKNRSSAGAQGPMQFMPATWRAYGLGGNVHNDRDAIMGAANYLRASGAPRDLRRALYAYNHSHAYVDSILRYTRLIERDVRNLYVFYSWQVFVRTTRGDVRLTGPGRAP